ncbi:glycosyltransferase family 39 protein [Rhizobium sp. S163]|uniref:ArnT family glycosyltransferase n=1 Tax=Rhizobium sp. S163 TaxID=3055039 RepID=UPI0025A972B2|nr:glycosyltransferase family 39 protein [Rhizobium sp. S163]MDM9645279.1 glycosyltransferase family 39 protein [Rhizobium sp. S163]
MQSKTVDAEKPLWIILAIVVCLLVLRQLMHQSMFFDGAIYASIARNLAEGAGSPWRLQFSDTLFSLFSEHPPLMMWLEAIGFLLFGDTIAVEKCFSLLTLIASGFILLKIWQRLHASDPELRFAGPMVLAMALGAGRVSWGFTNGMLENLLIVFTSLAIYCVVVAYGGADHKKALSRSVLMIAAGVLVALALMTKGLVGLFPLATPGIWWLAFRRRNLVSVIVDTLVMTATVVVFFAALWQLDDARDAIQRYLSIQLLPSLTGQRGSGGGNWNAVRAFIRVNAYPAIITLIIVLCDRRWGNRSEMPRDVSQARRRTAVFLALVGFSASLPLLASPRVASFYFNPSLAYFASAFAIAGAPAVVRAIRALNARAYRQLSVSLTVALALSAILVGFNFGRPGTDADTIVNAARIADHVCPSSGTCERAVAVCGAGAEDWALYGYLERRHKISLATMDAAAGNHIVVDDSCGAETTGYSDTGLQLSKYRLLQR